LKDAFSNAGEQYNCASYVVVLTKLFCKPIQKTACSA